MIKAVCTHGRRYPNELICVVTPSVKGVICKTYRQDLKLPLKDTEMGGETYDHSSFLLLLSAGK